MHILSLQRVEEWMSKNSENEYYALHNELEMNKKKTDRDEAWYDE